MDELGRIDAEIVDNFEELGELDSALHTYLVTFNDRFPMFPLGTGRTEQEVIAIINECIEKGKDVEELGYYEEPSIDVQY